MNFRHFPYVLHACNMNTNMHVCVNNMQIITCTDVKTGKQKTCMVSVVTMVTAIPNGLHLTTKEDLQYVEWSYTQQPWLTKLLYNLKI